MDKVIVIERPDGSAFWQQINKSGQVITSADGFKSKSAAEASAYERKVTIWNGLTSEQRRDVEHSGVCYFCGGRIVTRVYGECSWTTSCCACDFLYDED